MTQETQGRIACFPTAEATAPADSPFKSSPVDASIRVGTLQNLPLDLIIPNKNQPRKLFNYPSLLRLADSVKRYGVLQPITVRPAGGGDLNSSIRKYEIICGERRFRAAQIAGLDSIRCYVVHSDELAAAELSIVENLLREDLNMFEQAEAFNLLINTFNLTQQEVARRLSLSQSAIANKIRLLKLSSEERELIIEQMLTERHARALLRLSDPAIRIKFINLISRDKLNVAATEQLIDNFVKYSQKNQSISENAAEEAQMHKNPVGILRDFRVFSNSIEKAADMLRKSGICVETLMNETASAYTYTITIEKRHE